MNAFICDDEINTCAELEDFILQYAKDRSIHIHVDVFYSGDALINYLNSENKPNILFLDIELPGTNGIDIGHFIRNKLEDEQMFIIYISSREQYALQLFKNRPFDFMVKPFGKHEVFTVLDNIYKVIQKDSLFFTFQNQKSLYRISYKEILYFQSNGKKINIITFDGIKSFYGSLRNVKLPDFFLEIHKSYRINYNYVREYSYEQVTMLNGQILNISKINRTTVRRKILEMKSNDLIHA